MKMTRATSSSQQPGFALSFCKESDQNVVPHGLGRGFSPSYRWKAILGRILGQSSGPSPPPGWMYISSGKEDSQGQP